MTERTTGLTDDALRRALAELAGEPDATALLNEVVRTVDRMPQVPRRSWTAPSWRFGALVAAAVLATLGIGAAVALSLPRPDPQPTPSVPALLPDAIAVPDFVVPFTYVLPEGEADELNARGTVMPYPIYGFHRGSASLAVFLVTGFVHTCEDLDAVDPSASSGVLEGTSLGDEPALFIERLRDEVGVGIGPIRPSMLGNVSALEAEIDPADGTCSRALLHEVGLGLRWSEPELRGPSTLIVARTGESSIGVLISGADEAAYRDWLPIARAYVDSFVFEDAANR